VEWIDGDGVIEANGVGGLDWLVSGVLRDKLHPGVVERVASDLKSPVLQVLHFLPYAVKCNFKMLRYNYHACMSLF